MQRALKVGLIVGAVLLLVVYFVFDPRTSQWFPKCTFLTLTGYKCAGCGSQRVLHSLLQGDIAAAWHYNALLTAAVPVLGLYLFSHFTRERYVRLYNMLNHTYAIAVWIVVVIAWWVLRNVFGW